MHFWSVPGVTADSHIEYSHVVVQIAIGRWSEINESRCDALCEAISKVKSTIQI